MIYRLLTALTLTITPFGAHTTGGEETKATTTVVQATDVTETVEITEVPDVYELMWSEQLRTRKAAKAPFWEAVAWCETHRDWDNGGYYAGGLGMAQSVWRNYGGWQFAKSPAKATKIQQMIVANRVAFLGFQTKSVFRSLEDRQNNKPYFRPAVGWRSLKNWGKGCANWKTRKPHKNYGEEKVTR